MALFIFLQFWFIYHLYADKWVGINYCCINLQRLYHWHAASSFVNNYVVFCRVQQESVDEGERNVFLVNYVDYAFDDFGGRQPPVYPGLSTVWGSLARSKVI